MNAQDPGDAGVSVLVDIARAHGLDLNPGQRQQLDRLISQGLIAVLPSEPSSGRAKYRVTRKGQSLLDERGIGANES